MYDFKTKSCLKNEDSPAIESYYWTFDSYKYALLSDVESLKYKYRCHLAHVRSIVATNRLLVWNVDDGPDQVCRFLNKSGKNMQPKIVSITDYKLFFSFHF